MAMKNVAKFILMGMAAVVFVCYGSISAYAGGHCGGGYNGCGGRGRNQNYRSTYEETYRFSVLTAVGLLPIAVAGCDIDALMKGAAPRPASVP